MNIEVTQKADGWMLGTIEGGYEWQAKVYEKPSEFGINGGRVSKLFIRPVGLGWQPALISYDRGWDKRPETQDAKVVFETLLNSPGKHYEQELRKEHGHERENHRRCLEPPDFWRIGSGRHCAGRGIQYQDLCGGWDIDAGQRPCPSNGGRERVSDHHQAEQMSRNRPARAVCRG